MRANEFSVREVLWPGLPHLSTRPPRTSRVWTGQQEGRANQAEGTAGHKRSGKAKAHWTKWPDKRVWAKEKTRMETQVGSRTWD